jgi:ATP-dependent Clp protease adaptor protein ClpS
VEILPYPRYKLNMTVSPAILCAPPPDPDSDRDSPYGDVAVQTRPAAKKPAMYKVLLLNDDYTPMDFVVQVLEIFFNKSHEDALRIMLQVHQSGVGLCGIYTFEVAETKIAQVMSAARQAQHPLQCVMEKA